MCEREKERDRKRYTHTHTHIHVHIIIYIYGDLNDRADYDLTFNDNDNYQDLMKNYIRL